MNTIRSTAAATLAALGLAFAASAAHATDAAVADKPAAKAGTKAAAKKPRTPQQEKMAQCSKEAKGKKGEERRAFMSGCLGSKPAPAASGTK